MTDTAPIGPPEPVVTRVDARQPGRPFPHYLAVDVDGQEWELPQIHLARSPIVDTDHR